jgi:hypothetical protein
MSKKLYGVLLPILAVVAFASISGAAQAAPHWSVNGTKIPFRNTPKVPVVTSGTLTLANAALGGTITCRVIDAGNIWNPTGEGNGLDEINAFTNYECSVAPATVCEAGLAVTASGLPWATELFVDAEGVIRDRVKGVKVTVTCTKPVVSLLFEGELTPKWVNGTSVAKASFIEFDAKSGHLTNGTVGEGKVGGKDKVFGAEEQELITVSNP